MKRRFANRAARVIAPDDFDQQDYVLVLTGRLYDIRSQIAHGNKLGEADSNWLLENDKQVELRVRQVLRASVQMFPPGEKARRASLADVYDPTDQDRGDLAFGKFREIKTTEVRKSIADKIGILMNSS